MGFFKYRIQFILYFLIAGLCKPRLLARVGLFNLISGQNRFKFFFELVMAVEL